MLERTIARGIIQYEVRGLESVRAANAEVTRGGQAAGTSVYRGFSLGTQAIKSMGGALAAAGIGISLFEIGRSALTLSGQFETAKISFDQFLGSGQEAKNFMAQLAQFASSTPFDFKALTGASQKLLGVGIESQNVIPLLRGVGDAVAAVGTGDQGIERTIRALTQMSTRGKVTAEELNQLAEAGIPAYQILADQMGVTTGELQNMVTNGVVPADQAIQDLVTGFEKRFGGMMAKQSASLMGLMSNLRDETSQTLALIGDQMVKTFNIKGLLANTATGLSDFRRNLEFTVDPAEAVANNLSLLQSNAANAQTTLETLTGATDERGLNGAITELSGSLSGPAKSGFDIFARTVIANKIAQGDLQGAIAATVEAFARAELISVQFQQKATQALINSRNNNAEETDKNLGRLEERLKKLQSGDFSNPLDKIMFGIGGQREIDAQIEGVKANIATLKASMEGLGTEALDKNNLNLGLRAEELDIFIKGLDSGTQTVEQQAQDLLKILADVDQQAATLFEGMGTGKGGGGGLNEQIGLYESLIEKRKSLNEAFGAAPNEAAAAPIGDDLKKVQAQIDAMDKLRESESKRSSGVQNAATVMDDYRAKMTQIADLESLLGSSFDGTTTKVAETRAALEALMAAPDASQSQIQKLTDDLLTLMAAAGAMQTEAERFDGAMNRLGAQVAVGNVSPEAAVINLKDQLGEVAKEIENFDFAGAADDPQLQAALDALLGRYEALRQKVQEFSEQTSAAKLAASGFAFDNGPAYGGGYDSEVTQQDIAAEILLLRAQRDARADGIRVLTEEQQVRAEMNQSRALQVERLELENSRLEEQLGLIGQLGQLMSERQEASGETRSEGDNGIALTLQLLEQSSGPFETYQQALDAVTQAGVLNADVIAYLAEKYGVLYSTSEALAEPLEQLTARILGMGAEADAEGITKLKDEVQGLIDAGVGTEAMQSQLAMLQSVLDAMNPEPLSSVRQELTGLVEDGSLAPDMFVALNAALGEFEGASAEGLGAARDLIVELAIKAGLSKEVIDQLIAALDDAARERDVELDNSQAVEGLNQISKGARKMQDTLRETQPVASAIFGAIANTADMLAEKVKSGALQGKDAWKEALSVVGAGLQELGGGLQQSESEFGFWAGKALSAAGSIAQGFASGGPLGAAIAGAAALFDGILSAINRWAEYQKKVTEETQKTLDKLKEAQSYASGAGSINAEAATLEAEAAYLRGDINEQQYISRKASAKNQGITIDAQLEREAIYQELATSLHEADTLSLADPAARDALKAQYNKNYLDKYAAINRRQQAQYAQTGAQYQVDIASSFARSREEAEQEKADSAPGGSIAGMRKRIEELRKQQELTTSAARAQQLGKEIAGIEKAIDRMLGKGEENADLIKGSIGYYKDRINALRKKQDMATSNGQYENLEREIKGYEEQIAKISGSGAAGAKKGTLDYYEEQIKDLREKQGKTSNKGDYATLQRRIDDYQEAIKKITGDDSEKLIKGSVDYYEARINELKGAQGKTTSKGAFNQLQGQIDQYQKKIDAITGSNKVEEVVKNSLDYYKGEIAKLKDKQGKTTDRSQFDKIQGQIDRYQTEMDKISGEGAYANAQNSIAYYQDIIKDLKEKQSQTTTTAQFEGFQEQINKYSRLIDDIQGVGSDNLKNSIGYYEDVIADLKNRQKDARDETEFKSFQDEIDKYQAEIDKIAGSGGYDEGTIGFYEGIIADLKARQKNVSSSEEYAKLQSEIEKYGADIDKIRGEVNAETIRGSVGYYEAEIKKLRDTQKAATTRQGYREIQDSIDSLQQNILAITEDASADAIEGTLGFYEARIKALREAQQYAKSPGEYAGLQGEIAAYEDQIDQIKGLGDLEGSINYYTDLLRKKQEQFNKTADATVRAALAGEIDQLERTVKDLKDAATLAQGSLDAIRELYNVAAGDFAGSFKKAMDTADFSGFTENAHQAIREMVHQAILEGANSAKDFEALSDQVARALADGTLSQGELDSLQTEADQLISAREKTFELLDGLNLFGESLSSVSEGMGKMNEQLTNVPASLNLARLKYQSAAQESINAAQKATEADATTTPTSPEAAAPGYREGEGALTLSEDERKALDAESVRQLEAQALYLRERYAELKGRVGTADEQRSGDVRFNDRFQLDAIKKQLGQIPGQQLDDTPLSELYGRVGNTLGERQTTWSKPYYDAWLKKQAEQQQISDPNPEDAAPHTLPGLTAPGKGGPMISDPTTLALERQGRSFDEAMTLNPLTEPGATTGSVIDISERLEAVLKELAARGGGVVVEQATFNGYRNMREMYDEFKNIERAVGRTQHGSSAAR